MGIRVEFTAGVGAGSVGFLTVLHYSVCGVIVPMRNAVVYLSLLFVGSLLQLDLFIDVYMAGIDVKTLEFPKGFVGFVLLAQPLLGFDFYRECECLHRLGGDSQLISCPVENTLRKAVCVWWVYLFLALLMLSVTRCLLLLGLHHEFFFQGNRKPYMKKITTTSTLTLLRITFWRIYVLRCVYVSLLSRHTNSNYH